VPAATRVAILGDDSNPSRAISVRDAQAAAQALGIALLALPARAAADVDRAFAAAIAQQAPAVIVQPATLFFTERRRVVELAATHRLPAAYSQREYADAGGLTAYGTNLSELFVRAAPFVAKILTSRPPGALDVGRRGVRACLAAAAKGETCGRLGRRDRALDFLRSLASGGCARSPTVDHGWGRPALRVESEDQPVGSSMPLSLS
jgi:hypothetical protein